MTHWINEVTGINVNEKKHDNNIGWIQGRGI